MKNKLVLPLVVSILLVLLACSFGYEGFDFSGDEEANKLSTATAMAELIQGFGSSDSVDNGVGINQVTEEPVPTPLPAKPQPTTPPTTSEEEPSADSPVEYSVTSQNFDCICQETGTVSQEVKIEGDKLVLGDQTFDKIGDNSYRRSWMGYYILVSGEGENKTETKVDEERSVVITLTDTGYTMEHFQGASSSPCCIHTFTENK